MAADERPRRRKKRRKPEVDDHSTISIPRPPAISEHDWSALRPPQILRAGRRYAIALVEDGQSRTAIWHVLRIRDRFVLVQSEGRIDVVSVGTLGTAVIVEALDD